MKLKSILGLNTVKAFIVVMLSLAIIAVITLIVLGNLTDVSNTILPQGTGSKTNETVTIPNDAGRALSVNSLPNCVATVTQALNGSTVIGSGNYTVINGCYIKNLTSTYIDRNWNVSYTYTYDQDAEAGIRAVTRNTSNGTVSFFGNSTTFFALLGVVVIILIISLVVVVVNRFGGGGEYRSENPSL